MESQLNFGLKLTLKEMALRRVVVNLWTEPDILSSIKDVKFEHQRLTKSLTTLSDEVKAKVSKLVLPEPLKKRMMEIVKPIGSELMKWKTFHVKILCYSNDELSVPFLKKLSWTSAGMVDYRNTAENLTRLHMLEALKHYLLVCSYCFLDYFPILWKELPKACRQFYLSAVLASLVEQMKSHLYRAYILMTEHLKLDHVVVTLLSQDVAFRHLASEYPLPKDKAEIVECFFEDLTLEERRPLVHKAVDIVLTYGCYISSCKRQFPTEKHSEVLYRLLTRMRPEEQMEILKKRPCGILKCFMRWPWQDFFLEVASLVWTFLPENEYGNFCRMMAKSIRDSGYYCPEFFGKFFLNSPEKFKRHFLQCNDQLIGFFGEFFNAEDTETVRIILRSADPVERKRIVSHPLFFRFTDPIIVTDKWHLVKVCLDVAIPGKDDKDWLETLYMKYPSSRWTRDENFRKLQWRQIIRTIGQSESRIRSLMDETVTEAKKFREEQEMRALEFKRDVLRYDI